METCDHEPCTQPTATTTTNNTSRHYIGHKNWIQQVLVGFCHLHSPSTTLATITLLFRKYCTLCVQTVQWYQLAWGALGKNAEELLNIRDLKISMLYKNHIFHCMGKIFCVEFQRVPLKFHTKYLTHTLKDVDFIHRWKKCFWNAPQDQNRWTYHYDWTNWQSLNITQTNLLATGVVCNPTFSPALIVQLTPFNTKFSSGRWRIWKSLNSICPTVGQLLGTVLLGTSRGACGWKGNTFNERKLSTIIQTMKSSGHIIWRAMSSFDCKHQCQLAVVWQKQSQLFLHQFTLLELNKRIVLCYVFGSWYWRIWLAFS